MSGSASHTKSSIVGGHSAEENEESFIWKYARLLPGWESLRIRFSGLRLGGLLSCAATPETVPGSDRKRENGKKSKHTISEENSDIDGCRKEVDTRQSLLETETYSSSFHRFMGTKPDTKPHVTMSNMGSCEGLDSLYNELELLDTSFTCGDTPDESRNPEENSENARRKRTNAKFARDDSVSLWNLRKSLEGTTLLFHANNDAPSTSRQCSRDADEEITDSSDAPCFEPLLRSSNATNTKNSEGLTRKQHSATNETSAVKKRQAYAKRYYVISGDADDVISSDSETKENAYCETHSDYENVDPHPQCTESRSDTGIAAVESRPSGQSFKMGAIENIPNTPSSYCTEKKVEIALKCPYKTDLEGPILNPVKKYGADELLAGTDPSPCCSTCSGSSVSGTSEAMNKLENESRQNDTTSTDSPASSPSNIRSGSIRSLTRIFRRTTSKHHISSQLLCGYSMDRDYCVDQKTDRIFKSYLKPEAAHSSTNTVTSSRSRVPIQSSNYAQLRRQVMRKQYSDSIAVYYGQRMRRWRVKKQRSDSVNCPVDRAVLQRQDRIDEEFDPGEMNEKLLSTRDGANAGTTDDRKRLSEFEKYFPEKVTDLSWRGPR